MAEQSLIKVIIVDDHPVVRNGIANMLLVFDDIELIGQAGGGSELLTLCQKAVPDVILMDMVMPGMDGLETTREVLARYPDVKIVILTTFPKGELVQRALEAGAMGFLTKDAEIDALADAIRSAHNGRRILAPEATEALIEAKVNSPAMGADLSPREREILSLIVEGLSNQEIADQLIISPATVKNHVSACMSKLGTTNRVQAAVLAVELQLVPRSGSATADSP